MERYTATNRPRTYPAEERRRKRQALQAQAGQGGGGGGFVAPQQAGITAQPRYTPPQKQRTTPGLSDFARFAGAAGKMGLPQQQVQGLLNRRYGQQQGFGGGYMPPRRAIGGFQQPYGMQQPNYNQMGYGARTAGMYGGRPSYGGYGYGQFAPSFPGNYRMPPQQQGYGYGYGMNQQQAMMRPQYSYGAQVRQPWGGNNAIPRQNPYQQYRGWY